MPDLPLRNKPEGCQAAVVYGVDVTLPWPHTEAGVESAITDKRIKQCEVTAVCGDRGFTINRTDLAVNTRIATQEYTLSPDTEILLGAMCLNCPNRLPFEDVAEPQ